MRLLPLLVLALLAIPAQAQSAEKPDPTRLLQISDRARGAAPDGIRWRAEVTSVEDGTETAVTYQVRIHGDDALAEALEPARNRGELILFNDRNLWYYKPGLRKPVAISARQRLLGQASNGDIASTQYARDYRATISGAENVAGKTTWKLELKAKTRNATYDRIRYWVGQADLLAVKAEFLTLGGQIFKSATFEYQNQISRGGSKIPFVSRMTITDAANPGNKTALRYLSPVAEHQAASLFNVNNLIR